MWSAVDQGIMNVFVLKSATSDLIYGKAIACTSSLASLAPEDPLICPVSRTHCVFQFRRGFCVGSKLMPRLTEVKPNTDALRRTIVGYSADPLTPFNALVFPRIHLKPTTSSSAGRFQAHDLCGTAIQMFLWGSTPHHTRPNGMRMRGDHIVY